MSRTLAAVCMALWVAVSAPVAVRSTDAARSNQPPSDCVICLGPLTNATWNGVPPLGGYRRIGRPVRLHSRPEALFIGAQIDAYSAVVRWPLVKALDQFGTFAHVKPLKPICGRPKEPPGVAVPPQVCSFPTFDLSSEIYRSRYVAFRNRDVVDRESHCFLDRLSTSEWSLLVHFAQPASHKRSVLCARARSTGTIPAYLPLLLVDGYLQVGTYITTISDLEGAVEVQQSNGTTASVTYPYPFDTIHRALLTGKDAATTNLNYHVNAEANIITALVCHADGKKPASVCGRPVIKTILRHVK